MRCGLESRADKIRRHELDFVKNDRAAVRVVRKMQYNNLFYLFIILYNNYNLLFIRLAVITHN